MKKLPLIAFALLFSVSLIENSCRREGKTGAELKDLIEKNLLARGGRDKLEAVRSLRIFATYVQRGRENPLVLTILRPDRVFAELLDPSRPMICGYDGETAWWLIRDGRSKPEILPAEMALIFTRYADIGDLFLDHEKKGQASEWVGMEDVNGQKAHKLKMASRGGIIRHVFLDAGNFLEVKESFRSQSRKDFGMEVIFKDFRTVEGITFPFYHDLTEEQMIVERIEINVDVDDSIFQMPRKLGKASPLSVAEFSRNLDAYLEKATRLDSFSGIVLVARGGKPIFKKAYGMADRERKIFNQVGTRFCIGSMNKMFTAVAIAQLVEQGKLSYDDLIGKYLGAEWIPSAVGEEVKISHLLSHTSGIAELLTDEFYASSAKIYRTLKDYRPFIKGKSLTFTPGTRWEYCNTGFFLLGAIIEKVSGKDYWDYIKGYVFSPAGMEDTISFDRSRNLPNLAMGYEKGQEGGKFFWKKTAHAGKVNGSSAGGGFSTVDDLLKFAGALKSDRLIRRESRELLMSVKAKSDSGDIEYGYGFLIDHDDRLGRIIGHGGAAPGVSANFRILVDQNCTMIILSNYDEASLPVSSHIRSLLPLK